MSGVVGILLILAMTLLQATRAWGRGAEARRVAAEARLASAGGMEYAASRLSRGRTYPRFSTSPLERGDDWTFRDDPSTPLSASLNVSYAHGDAWTEGGTPDGRYDAASDLFSAAVHDRDGDGRFSAWSGRLRGGASPFALRFVLRVEAADAKLPLNAGSLLPGSVDGIDNDGNGLVDEPREMTPPNGLDDDGDGLIDEPDEALIANGIDDNGNGVIDEPGEEADLNANGIDDHRDLDFPYHAGLAHALDNLGATLKDGAGAYRVNTRRAEVPTGGDPIRVSWLGHDLISRRPVGGYRDWRQVEEALLTLPNAPPYEGAPYTRAELDAIRPYIDLGPYVAMETSSGSWGCPYAPVNLLSASREALLSLWMYVGTPGDGASFIATLQPPSPWPFPSLAPRPGYLPGEAPAEAAPCPHTGIAFSSVPRLIWPEEAEALADAAIAYRREGSPSWRGFRERLAADAASIFARDAAALAAFPQYRASWIRMKTDLAFRSVAVDEGGSLFRIGYPASFPASTAPLAVAAGPGIRSEGATLAPPVRFLIRSESVPDGAAVEGGIRAAERLEFASQEDFEIMSGGAFLARRTGIEVKNSPFPWTRRDALSPTSPPRVVSLPNWNLRSKRAVGCFPRNAGALALATKDIGRGVAQIYWPFVEDFDGVENKPPAFPTAPSWIEMWPSYVPAPVPAWRVVPSVRGIQRSPYWAELTFPGTSTCFGGARWAHPALGWREYDPIRTMTVEGYMTHGSSLWLGKAVAGQPPWSDPHHGLKLEVNRAYRDPRRPGTCFLLRVTNWFNLRTIVGNNPSSSSAWLVEDDPASPSAHFHVVLTLERQGAGTAANPWRTVFRLTVNGSNLSADGPMVHIHDGSCVNPPGNAPPHPPWFDGSMLRGRHEIALLRGMDKVRLYDGIASPPVPVRFVPRGTYTSPLYDLNASTELLDSQWTGAVPASWSASSLETSVTGYWDESGASVAATVSLPPGGAGAASDLRALGMPDGIRSFRFQVIFTAPGGNVNETPVFESIWFTLRRQGTAPAWTAWESR